MKKMLSNNDEVSHKRVISICAGLCLVAALVANFIGKTVQTDLIVIFAGLCGGESILTVIEKFKQ